jgi:hypothetical protein
MKESSLNKSKRRWRMSTHESAPKAWAETSHLDCSISHLVIARKANQSCFHSPNWVHACGVEPFIQLAQSSCHLRSTVGGFGRKRKMRMKPMWCRSVSRTLALDPPASRGRTTATYVAYSLDSERRTTCDTVPQRPKCNYMVTRPLYLCTRRVFSARWSPLMSETREQ